MQTTRQEVPRCQDFWSRKTLSLDGCWHQALHRPRGSKRHASEQAACLFRNLAGMRLLRSPHAPFIIDWLDRQFKQAGRIVVPHSDLLAALAEYQEELRETDPDRLIGHPATSMNSTVPTESSLLSKLTFREGHTLLPWVKAELQQRFDYRCCDTVEEFQQCRGLG